MRQPRVFTISFKKSAKKYKSSFFLEKSVFSWLLSKQISFFFNLKSAFAPNRATENLKIFKFLCFSCHFSLDISVFKKKMKFS